MNVVWLSLGLFFLFMILGVPIAMSIGLAAGASLLAMDTSLVVMAQKMFISTNSFTLIAIPFFMLVGAIMDRSGITEMLVNFAKACIGWIRYGMVYVTILAGILMGGISGSATADTAALSCILIPTMERQGYPRNFTAPLQASAGTLGVIIPPSLCMIVLGSVTNLQVSKLFIAGIIPGCIVGLCIGIISFFICRSQGFGESDTMRFSLKLLGKSTKEAVWALLIPVIIVGGILAGVFTPTEASVIAVVYTLFVALMVTKTIRLKDIPAIFCDAARSTGTVMFVIGTSAVWSWILSYANIPGMLADAITSFTQSPFVVMMIITVIFLIGGMFSLSCSCRCCTRSPRRSASIRWPSALSSASATPWAPSRRRSVRHCLLRAHPAGSSWKRLSNTSTPSSLPSSFPSSSCVSSPSSHPSSRPLSAGNLMKKEIL